MHNLFTLWGKYAVPLSHYNKDKHASISNKLDFQKVVDEKGKCLSVLNINNMIPVTDAVLIPVDMKIHTNDSAQEMARKILHIKEITWCRKHADIIENKVKQLYELCTTESNYKGKNRCLKFKELEVVCNKYNK